MTSQPLRLSCLLKLCKFLFFFCSLGPGVEMVLFLGRLSFDFDFFDGTPIYLIFFYCTPISVVFAYFILGCIPKI